MTTKGKMSSSTNLQHVADNYLQSIHHWVPPVPVWKPVRKTTNSSLRLACIVEDRLYHGLRYEGELLLLTPQNWKETIMYGNPDILLMDSFWGTSTGHWQMAQCSASPFHEELLEIISLARELSIPTVYWITKGQEYHNHYKDFARKFDFVFCADPNECLNLHNDGIDAEILLPCAQPVLCNPFREYTHCQSFGLGNLYDGWADLDQKGHRMDILREVKPYGLSIIESQYHLLKKQIDSLPEYEENILGCVTYQSRILALKYSKTYLSHDCSVSSSLTKQWMAVEAAACRLPVIHFGELQVDDIRKKFAREYVTENDFLLEVFRCKEDDLYRQRIGHFAWREVNMNHTFAHRLKIVCNRIGISHTWDEFPKVSVITLARRWDLFQKALNSFEHQTYPNKEIVVLCNKKVIDYDEALSVQSHEDIHIVDVPEDLADGATFNYGHLYTKGSYCFYVHGDCDYGPNYILDMMLHTRSVDPDCFVKPECPVGWEDEGIVSVSTDIPSLSIVALELLIDDKVRISSNSIAGTKTFFNEVGWNNTLSHTDDSSLLLNLDTNYPIRFAIMDDFNFVQAQMEELNCKATNLSTVIQRAEDCQSALDLMV